MDELERIIATSGLVGKLTRLGAAGTGFASALTSEAARELSAAALAFADALDAVPPWAQPAVALAMKTVDGEARH